MKFIKVGEEHEWTLEFEQQVDLADGSVLIPFTPNIVIQSNDEIVDYSFGNFAAVQCYSHVGRQLLTIADKFDLELEWKRYDKIFIPHQHYKNGKRIENSLNVWVVGVSKEDNICRLVFHVLE